MADIEPATERHVFLRLVLNPYRSLPPRGFAVIMAAWRR